MKSNIRVESSKLISGVLMCLALIACNDTVDETLASAAPITTNTQDMGDFAPDWEAGVKKEDYSTIHAWSAFAEDVEPKERLKAVTYLADHDYFPAVYGLYTAYLRGTKGHGLDVEKDCQKAEKLLDKINILANYDTSYEKSMYNRDCGKKA